MDIATLKLKEVCKKHRISLAYLFGSQAGEGIKLLSGDEVGVSDPLADLDVGVVTVDPLPEGLARARLYSSIFSDLEDLFSPLPLDLVFLEENHSVFQLEAVKGKCVYSLGPDTRDRYETYVLRRAADFRPFLEKYYMEILEDA